MKVKSSSSAVLTGILGLIFCIQSYASAPLIDRYTQPFNFPIIDCGDYLIWTDGEESIAEKWWYDESGDPVKLQFSVRIRSSKYYNGGDPGKSITQGTKGVGENQSYKDDFITEDEHWSGLPFRLTVPGIGHVLLDAGTWKWDAAEETLTHNGPDFVLSEGDVDAALCEALR